MKSYLWDPNLVRLVTLEEEERMKEKEAERQRQGEISLPLFMHRHQKKVVNTQQKAVIYKIGKELSLELNQFGILI